MAPPAATVTNVKLVSAPRANVIGVSIAVISPVISRYGGVHSHFVFSLNPTHRPALIALVFSICGV
jgi:hypothetical protein